MILDKNQTVTVSIEALNKYGPTAAVILQVLYNHYQSSEIKLDYPEWTKAGGILSFMDSSVVASTITKLDTRGKIELDKQSGTIKILDTPVKKEKTVVDTTDKKKKPVVRENFEMALVLCEVDCQTPGMETPKRFLRFATELVNKGYTREFIKDRYCKGGWWYQTQYKGQQGGQPTEADIRRTLEIVDSGKTVVSDQSSGFFR